MTSDRSSILRTRRLTYGFSPGETFLGPIDIELAPKAICAVVGPNGAGKSTLLRLLVGLLSPVGGEVELMGKPLATMSLMDRARRIAFLPQHPLASPSATAEEIVRLGRHPYRGFGLFESPADLRVVRESLRLTEALGFSHRRMETLSGGEAQRVHLAAALAQQPQVLALDEPTAGLDLYHQLHIFDLLRNLTEQSKLAVIVVTHDLNLASQYCDHAIVLNAGSLVAQGTPETVLTVQHLEPIYHVHFAALQSEGIAQPWLIAHNVRNADAREGD